MLYKGKHTQFSINYKYFQDLQVKDMYFSIYSKHFQNI